MNSRRALRQGVRELEALPLGVRLLRSVHATPLSGVRGRDRDAATPAISPGGQVVDERVDLAIGGLDLHLEEPADVLCRCGRQPAVEVEHHLLERDHPVVLRRSDRPFTPPAG